MTMHSAKGLEFPVVFVAGLEEGVFPSYRSLLDENEIEEERRLCYVGITRAREKLYLTNAFCRTLFGNTTYNKASRFLKEIPQQFFAEDSTRAAKTVTKTVESSSSIKSDVTSRPSFGRPVSSVLNQPVKTSAGSTFNAGDNVEHKKFGVGVITAVEKEGDDFKLEIQFKNAGMKRLMAAFANLRKL
jgi:DNA helicase-2/ATP-dependent DNA helicase PcrA